MNKILITIMLIPSISLAKIPLSFTAELEKSGRNKISTKDCEEMEKKMGQLMYINVDGFGSKEAIDPAYNQLVNRIQVGGVLPHYTNKDPYKIKKANEDLQKQTEAPLMIGVDYVYTKNKNNKESISGLGAGSGIMGEIGDRDIACYGKISKIDAAIHKLLGINNPLGPTIEKNKNWGGSLDKNLAYKEPRLTAVIDQFRNMGLETTIKHYPYTPDDYNLHKSSPDTKIPEAEVDKVYLPIFKSLKDKSGMLMTTHLYNSEVDPNNMATFSKKWMKKLREEVGFQGIVMTDALFMINNYSDTMKQMARDFPITARKDLDEEFSLFAVKAILAGHDMILLESSANKTEHIWKNLVAFSCSESKIAAEFRGRVKESYDRISTYKKKNYELKEIGKVEDQGILDSVLELRRDLNKTCEMPEEKIDKLVSKLYSQPTSISCDVFCSPKLKQVDPLTASIVLNKDYISKLSLEDIVKNLNELNGDELLKLIDLLKQDPHKIKKIRDYAFNLLKSKKRTERMQGLEVLTTLELWQDDNSYLEGVIASNNLENIEDYILYTQKGRLPKLSAESPLISKFLNMIESYPLEKYINIYQSIIPTSLDVKSASKQVLSLTTSTKAKISSLLQLNRNDAKDEYKKLDAKVITSILSELILVNNNCSTDYLESPNDFQSNSHRKECTDIVSEINRYCDFEKKWPINDVKQFTKQRDLYSEHNSGDIGSLVVELYKLSIRVSKDPTEIKFALKNLESRTQNAPDELFPFYKQEVYKTAFIDEKMTNPESDFKAFVDILKFEIQKNNGQLWDNSLKEFVKAHEKLFSDVLKKN